MLIEGAHIFGLDLSKTQVQVLTIYLSYLLTWNQRLNLTSIQVPELMIRRHLIDCMAVVPLLCDKGRLMDVGSGAGLPGIPIKILQPDKEIILLEPRRKRANFLRHAIRSLGLTGIHVLEERIESLHPDRLDLLDETIARAFSDNEAFLRASAVLLRSHGTCLLMHGPKGLDFLKKENATLQSLGFRTRPPYRFRLPFGGEQRIVLCFEKA